MTTQPNYDKWSSVFLEELYNTPEDQRGAFVKANLLQAHWRGHTDGVDNGWWKEQEADVKAKIAEVLDNAKNNKEED